MEDDLTSQVIEDKLARYDWLELQIHKFDVRVSEGILNEKEDGWWRKMLCYSAFALHEDLRAYYSPDDQGLNVYGGFK